MHVDRGARGINKRHLKSRKQHKKYISNDLGAFGISCDLEVFCSAEPDIYMIETPTSSNNGNFCSEHETLGPRQGNRRYPPQAFFPDAVKSFCWHSFDD
jgi:hypothetical protein